MGRDIDDVEMGSLVGTWVVMERRELEGVGKLCRVSHDSLSYPGESEKALDRSISCWRTSWYYFELQRTRSRALGTSATLGQAIAPFVNYFCITCFSLSFTVLDLKQPTPVSKALL